jgi:hypothetical protein
MRVVPTAALAAVTLVVAVAGAAGTKSAAYHPAIDPKQFRAVVDNPYFPLAPGTVWNYDEKTGRYSSQDEVRVTVETRVVMGVRCVVVHDVERSNGRVIEDTYDWYAQDQDGNVWYFGEDTKEFHSNGKVDRSGSWEAGVRGAQPGVVMAANPQPGAPYRQEYLAGVAEDMGQVVAVGATVTVPCGAFHDCVRTKDWSTLEKGSEKKWYARGIGVVRTESTGGEIAVLVSMKRP